jgi:hypothetical protein
MTVPSPVFFQLATYEGSRWAYWYPSDDTIQYLYESYPDNISPIQGVENEHFMVWMRYVVTHTSSTYTSKKLLSYGYIQMVLLLVCTVAASTTVCCTLEYGSAIVI